MGLPMILRLLEDGRQMIVHDKAVTAFTALDGYGALIVESPQHVADFASIVFTSLPDAQALKEAVLGVNGVVQVIRYRRNNE
ncbi:hypothetical protein CR155_19775 [Pollutimonas nitritireducens]|uniref:6-phosphogluconate dehydrogenase NADP-binding domain-containing protein n=2 Tax=Pollutimonas nitritireducens TaxID=2045209 RepID=A0A2N4UAV3_9BURK|nr:hypothetical protein CR155_19775 [Pollutimonas nitritireducens]